MVKQTITYSDGSETVINYRGVIVGGELTLNEDVGTPKKARAPRKTATLMERVKKVISRK